MRQTPSALLRALPLALLCALLLALPARADSAPKPDLTVTVVNAPEGECYVDLLYQSDGGQLFSEINPEHYDPQLLSALHALEGGRLGPGPVKRHRRGTHLRRPDP